MRFYFFDRHYGHDRVVKMIGQENIFAGDFFEIQGLGYCLCLGEEISRVEQYTGFQNQIVQGQELIMIQKKLFSNETLELIHWFTRHRFCTYKKAIPLRIQDPEQIATRKPKKNIKNTDISQELFVYPNLWSIMNDGNLDVSKMTFLHGKSTRKQKAEAFWRIRNSGVEKIICTYSQMFKERYNLTSITLVDQHARWYKNQQDPRYHTVVVVKEMSKILNTKLHVSGYEI